MTSIPKPTENMSQRPMTSVSPTRKNIKKLTIKSKLWMIIVNHLCADNQESRFYKHPMKFWRKFRRMD